PSLFYRWEAEPRQLGFRMSKKQGICRVAELLDGLKEEFPRRAQAAEALLLKHYGVKEGFELAIQPSEGIRPIPTFQPGVEYEATPMLKARYEYAAGWHEPTDHWLGISEMVRFMTDQEVLGYHQALREHCEGSAPMLFPDRQLTLYAR